MSRGSSSPDRCPPIVKLVVLGDSGVGKSTLVHRWCGDGFVAQYKATVGTDLLSRTVAIDGDEVCIQLWDTGGMERFHSLGRSYFKGASGVLLVFDVTSAISFQHLSLWMEEFLDVTGRSGISIVCVGNKTDLAEARQVLKSGALNWCRRNAISEQNGPIPYFEVSALTMKGVDDAMMQLAASALMHTRTYPVSPNRTVRLTHPNTSTKPSYCRLC